MPLPLTVLAIIKRGLLVLFGLVKILTKSFMLLPLTSATSQLNAKYLSLNGLERITESVVPEICKSL